MKKSSSIYTKIIHLFLSLLLIASTGETYLLFHHYPLNKIHETSDDNNDRFSRLLGWDNKPNMKITSNGEEPIAGQENVDHLGRRYHGKDVVNPSKRFLFLGCSYAFGTEISDEDTFIYKTAQRFPQWQFDNYSVPGYGTHQCRNKMAQLLLKPNCPKYDCVFYVFMNDHPPRMVYDYSSYLNKKNELVGICPYADFSLYGTVRYHPFDEVFLPFTNIFRISAFFNNLYAAIKSEQAQDATYINRLYNAVLDDMLSLSQEHDLDLHVIILNDSEFYVTPELMKKGLNVHDARLRKLCIDPKYHVGNDVTRHPNGLANDYWANRLTVLLNKKYQ